MDTAPIPLRAYNTQADFRPIHSSKLTVTIRRQFSAFFYFVPSQSSLALPYHTADHIFFLGFYSVVVKTDVGFSHFVYASPINNVDNNHFSNERMGHGLLQSITESLLIKYRNICMQHEH